MSSAKHTPGLRRLGVVHRLEVYSAPDALGRVHHVRCWNAAHPGDVVAGIAPGEIRERCQHFFAPLPAGFTGGES